MHDRTLATKDMPLLNRGGYISESNRTMEDNEALVFDTTSLLKKRTHISELDFDRIYKVVRDRDVYWLGVRNQGLRKCRVDGDSLVDTNGGFPMGRKCFSSPSHDNHESMRIHMLMNMTCFLAIVPGECRQMQPAGL